ncbi:hypothetical protein C8034_v005936 [Colletotrichum sidae]|uniref:Uncharacterized protein n=1 Tax=Colletotrichum sidae TaxID=1347389 RepID=A0A4R8T5U0_9PEZI|nr:hypothetical protein C8034_v005936 [Colletotrichum sidae]
MSAFMSVSASTSVSSVCMETFSRLGRCAPEGHLAGRRDRASRDGLQERRAEEGRGGQRRAEASPSSEPGLAVQILPRPFPRSPSPALVTLTRPFLACSPTQLYLTATFSRLALPRRLRLLSLGLLQTSELAGTTTLKKKISVTEKEKREDPTKIAARSPIRNPWSPYDYTALQNVSRSRDPSPGMSPRRFTLGPQPEQSVIRSTRPSQRQQSVRWVWAVEARAGREVRIQRFETNLKHRYRATKYKHDVSSRQTGA